MKIYYTVDTTRHGYPVLYIDLSGNVQTEMIGHIVNGHVDYSPGDIDQEFQHAHPGAVYLNQHEFSARCYKLEQDRQKLAAWNKAVSR